MSASEIALSILNREVIMGSTSYASRSVATLNTRTGAMPDGKAAKLKDSWKAVPKTPQSRHVSLFRPFKGES
jgi:hypothetical protein